MQKRTAVIFFVGFFFQLFSYSVFSQTITVNPYIQRYLGDVSDLDRSKYFTTHESGDYDEVAAFRTEYDVYKGRGFWGPFGYAKNRTGVVGEYLDDKVGNTAIRNVTRYIATEHPGNVFKIGLDTEKAANWAAEYYKNYVGDAGRPEFYEPMNEPFVHSKDFCNNSYDPVCNAQARTEMAQLFNAIGASIKATPELASMKVIGYASAYPSYELNDFSHWIDRTKLFIDIAGSNMDGISTHLYDGINVTGESTVRSGSNSEAILDLIEAYNYIKWSKVPNHAITEYGGIESGYPAEYSDMKSVQSVKSMNHLLFNFLERQNNLLISISFTSGKAEWHLTEANNYQPYGAVLWRPENLGEAVPTGWVYTARVLFYDLWKGVKGQRVYVDSDHPDVQVQAFKDENKVFVALNNLNESTLTVNTNVLVEPTLVENVVWRSLKIYNDTDPVYQAETSATPLENVTLIPGETVVLQYNLKQSLEVKNVIRLKKYYTDKYLQAITANNAMSFTFNKVETGSGKAVLRMAIGRKHNVSKQPVITVNGNQVSVPTNWKGYDQANRADFFGTIEIPVPMEYLKENNTVTISFPDNGGHLSSLILMVEKLDQDTYAAQDIIIEAEDFNATGGTYEDSNVGFGVKADGTYMSWVNKGDWSEYTFTVPKAGSYDISYFISSPHSNSQIFLLVDDQAIANDEVPNNGDWFDFQKLESQSKVSLSAGEHKLTLKADPTNVWQWNLDKIIFTSNSDVPTKSFEENASKLMVYPNPMGDEVIVQAEESIKSIELCTANGVKVISKKCHAPSTRMNTSSLYQGIYLLVVELEDGSRKLVKLKK